jgi:hypothetical protein
VVVALASGLGACATRGEPDRADRYWTTPTACQLVQPQKARQLTGAVRGGPQDQPTDTRNTCRWPVPPKKVRGRPAPPQPPRSLSVAVTMRNSPVGQDDVRGEDLAAQDYGKWKRNDRAGRGSGLRGIGDQAYGQFTDRRGHVVLRDGNALVTVNLTQPPPPRPDPGAQQRIRQQTIAVAGDAAAKMRG